MSNFLLQMRSGLSMYFCMIKVLCLILNAPLDDCFDGDYFSCCSAWSSSMSVGLISFLSGLWASSPFYCLDFFFQDSSSLPTQYSFISLWRVGRSLKTWIPLPRLRCVGFRSQRLKPSKWLRGHESLVCVLFSKLKDLNFVAFWFMPPWPLVL